MARNMIQFGKGLSLVDFLRRYDSEQACHDVLFKLHWPEGFRCPECGNATYCELKSRELVQRYRCHHQA